MEVEKSALFQFIEEKTTESEIDMNTGLEDDLGVYGDDAVELMIDYGKHFHVDVSNFMFADYFSGEGNDLFLGLFRKNKKARKMLTVGHLYKGIIAGRLDEDVINSGMPA